MELKENGYWISELIWCDFHNIDPLSSLQYDELVDSLSLNDVRRAAQKYFDMENYVRVVLLPADKESD